MCETVRFWGGTFLRETKEKEVELWMVIRGALGFLRLRRGTSRLCNRDQVSWILSFFFWWGCLVAEKMGEKFLVMGIWSLGSWLFVMWVMEKVKFL